MIENYFFWEKISYFLILLVFKEKEIKIKAGEKYI